MKPCFSLRRATEFLQEVTRRGGRILFVAARNRRQEAIKEAALACGQFYVNQRWAGRHVDQPRDHSQEHRATEIHRRNREITRIQEDGQAGAGGS